MTVQLFAGTGSGDNGWPVAFSEIYIPIEASADGKESARRLAAALCQNWGCFCVIRTADPGDLCA